MYDQSNKLLKLFQKLLFAVDKILSRSEDEMVCPRCTAFSEILTISLLTIIPDSIPLVNLPLKINSLLLLPLKSISNSETYCSQTLARIDNADLHGANSMMSSA